MGHCDEYLERISAAVDGALSPDEQAELEKHFSVCPECRSLYRDLLQIHDGFQDFPAVEAPEDLTRRVMDAVADTKVVAFPAKKRNQWKKWMASAAVLAVVIAAGQSGWGGKTASTDMAVPQTVEAAPAGGPAETSLERGVTADSVFDGSDTGVQSRSATGGAPEDAQPAMTSLDGAEQPVAQSIGGAESAPIEPRDGSEPVLYSGNAMEMPAGAREVDHSSEEGTIFTADDALDALLAEFPQPGCESWEVENIQVGWRSPELAEEGAASHRLEYVSDDDGYTFELQTYGEEGDGLCLSRFTVFFDGTIAVTQP